MKILNKYCSQYSIRNPKLIFDKNYNNCCAYRDILNGNNYIFFGIPFIRQYKCTYNELKVILLHELGHIVDRNFLHSIFYTYVTVFWDQYLKISWSIFLIILLCIYIYSVLFPYGIYLGFIFIILDLFMLYSKYHYHNREFIADQFSFPFVQKDDFIKLHQKFGSPECWSHPSSFDRIQRILKISNFKITK